MREFEITLLDAENRVLRVTVAQGTRRGHAVNVARMMMGSTPDARWWEVEEI